MIPLAIASVMGAYLLLYPRSTVVSLIPIVFIFPIVVLPAPVDSPSGS